MTRTGLIKDLAFFLEAGRKATGIKRKKYPPPLTLAHTNDQIMHLTRSRLKIFEFFSFSLRTESARQKQLAVKHIAHATAIPS